MIGEVPPPQDLQSLRRGSADFLRISNPQDLLRKVPRHQRRPYHVLRLPLLPPVDRAGGQPGVGGSEQVNGENFGRHPGGP